MNNSRYDWDDIALVLHRGRSLHHLAGVLNITTTSLERAAARAGRNDIARLIHRRIGITQPPGPARSRAAA